MNPTRTLRPLALALAFALAFALPDPAAAQTSEWRYWGGDAGSTRYSALDQIRADNFANLEVAWRWKAANFGPERETYYRATPIYADGVLYTVAGERRAVAAIDPTTGETLWTWRMDEGLRWEKAPRRFSGRGLAYWSDGRNDRRILVVTPGFHLVALDARTGMPVNSFGENGVVDLMAGLGYELVPWTGEPGPMAASGANGPRRATAQEVAALRAAGEEVVHGIDPLEGQIGNSSPAIVVGDVVVVGNSTIQGYYPLRLKNIPGGVRGFDVRTGRRLWIFNLVPKPGEPGAETWLDGSLATAGKVDPWATFSADLERGLVFIPVGHAHNDHFGGHRPGDNLYSQSVVALNARTGRKAWHYQMIHHDIWNYDTSTAPNVVDITVNGRRIPAIVQTTKQGWAYVLDRTTGQPVWPIEERPVAKSDVPTEWTSPTQPHPTRPAAFERQGVSTDDFIDFTPELRAQAIELAKGWRLGPIFTPPAVRDRPLGTQGTVLVPGVNGGVNIMGGAAADPETGILYVASQSGYSAITLVSDSNRSEMLYASLGPGGALRGPQGLPLLKPPYGRITAIDLNTGDHLWMIPNGDTPDYLENHPALAGVDIPRTGKSGHANVLVTKSLLFYGEGRGGGALFHAVDKKTGRELGTIELPAPTNAAPMTYLHDGRQYIVVAIASGDVPAELVALRLPVEN